MPDLKYNLTVLSEQAHRFAHMEEGLRSGWRHLLGPHLHSTGLLKEAQELHSRCATPVEPDFAHEVEEEVRCGFCMGGRGRGHASGAAASSTSSPEPKPAMQLCFRIDNPVS